MRGLYGIFASFLAKMDLIKIYDKDKSIKLKLFYIFTRNNRDKKPSQNFEKVFS